MPSLPNQAHSRSLDPDASGSRGGFESVNRHFAALTLAIEQARGLALENRSKWSAPLYDGVARRLAEGIRLHREMEYHLQACLRSMGLAQQIGLQINAALEACTQELSDHYRKG